MGLLEDERALNSQLWPEGGEYRQDGHSGNDEAVRDESVFEINDCDGHKQRDSRARHDYRRSPTEFQVGCGEKRPHQDLDRDNPRRNPLDGSGYTCLGATSSSERVSSREREWGERISGSASEA